MEINNQKQLSELIFKEDDITWQSMIYELAREGKIDPWDIDVSILAQEYISMMRKLKELNFRLSGKVVLAAAILLKLKADRLGITELLALTQEQVEEGDEDLVEQPVGEKHFTKADLGVRIPQPRKRKVTVHELIDALKKALEVDERKQQRYLEIKRAAEVKPIIRKIDIFSKIESVYVRIKEYIRKFKRSTIEFTELVPSKEKKDIIWTFIPLLHLACQDRLELIQEEPFGKIYVKVNEKSLGARLMRNE